MKIEIRKTIELVDDDFIQILSSANCWDGIGHWAELHDNEKHYSEAKQKLIENGTEKSDICMEDVWLQELKMGYPLVIYDFEDDAKYDVTMKDIENGIKYVINNQHWNGDAFDCDADVSDRIFQFAIFGDVIYS